MALLRQSGGSGHSGGGTDKKVGMLFRVMDQHCLCKMTMGGRFKDR